MTRRFAFRVDASVAIGSGHAMRCLTLADALKAEGGDCLFLSRTLTPGLHDRIVSSGHRLRALPGAEAAGPVFGAPSVHDQRADAAEFVAALEGEAPDWIVVDHYGLGATWEAAARPAGARVLAIDDLADRPHACDVLLDQVLGRRAADYAGLVAPGCALLAGPRYALLRPEFSALRPMSLERRRDGRLSRIMIAMGGTDPDAAACAAVRALAGLAPDVAVSVVAGGGTPSLAELRRLVSGAGRDAEICVDVTDMGARLVEVDLVLGAGGTSSWERCCLGVPTIVSILADNQRETADAIGRAGAGVCIGAPGDEDWSSRLAEAVERFRDPAALSAASRAAAQLCDGAGARRVLWRLLGPGLEARPATEDDARRVWEWRHAGGAARLYATPREVPFEEHLAWFRAALADAGRRLLVVEVGGVPAAHVRFDHTVGNPACAEVSIVLDPAVRGRGLAERCLDEALRQAADSGTREVTARVHGDNAASIRLFERSGFARTGRAAQFQLFRLDLDPAGG